LLKIDLKPGEAITIGNVVVTLEEKSGKLARLSVQADRSIPVKRVTAGQGGIAKLVAENGITHKP
jgi:hypothetical protein